MVSRRRSGWFPAYAVVASARIRGGGCFRRHTRRWLPTAFAEVVASPALAEVVPSAAVRVVASPGCVMVLVGVVCVKSAFGVPSGSEQVPTLDPPHPDQGRNAAIPEPLRGVATRPREHVPPKRSGGWVAQAFGELRLPRRAGVASPGSSGSCVARRSGSCVARKVRGVPLPGGEAGLPKPALCAPAEQIPATRTLNR